MADAIPQGLHEGELKKIILDDGYVSLANNTKWNELITEFRERDSSCPRFRYKTVDGFISRWDLEWCYHLPFPFKYVLWFDLNCEESKRRGNLVEDEIKSHVTDVATLVKGIGLDFEVNENIIRIFGYSPKDYELFEKKK